MSLELHRKDQKIKSVEVEVLLSWWSARLLPMPKAVWEMQFLVGDWSSLKEKCGV